ncbi:hypothetical protein [Streptomyces sp. TLI_105]|uniref:hypothetical protein n=1 Tax=Streptomyces sp. TLI_105 TaxID=1881019 RepID=UPI000899C0C8|nr:hypothetical protein [Streptomyces sp. TLI_105]SED38328.1 hypothetical protein SAMN05428939_5044 [Streptomyces sp. TLI_105]
MNTENARSRHPNEPTGCLTGVARAIALVIVLPVRLVWDALAYCLKQLWRWVLAPLGRALGWLIHHLLVIPLRFLWEWVLAPVGRALWWVIDLLIVTPLKWLGRWVLLPVAKAVWRVVDLLLVTPLTWLWRYVLAPVGRAVGAAVAWAWRIGGLISRALGRAVGWVLWNAIGRPLAWTYRVILTPLGHWLRTWVWAPLASVGRAVRAAAREVRLALFGGPR